MKNFTIEEIITNILKKDIGLNELKLILEEQEELSSMLLQKENEIYIEENQDLFYNMEFIN